jgi:hypothetical protein
VTRALLLVALLPAAAEAKTRKPWPACHPAGARVYAARLVGDQLTACFEVGGPRTCWQLAIHGDGTWTPAPPTAIVSTCGSLICPPAAPPPAAQISSTTTVTRCAADPARMRTAIACHTLILPTAPAPDLVLAASANRAWLAIAGPDGEHATAFDVTHGKLVGTTAAWPVPDTGLGWSLRYLAFVGDRLVLERADGVHTRGRLVDPATGKTLAALADDAALDQAPPIDFVYGPVAAVRRVAVATADGEAVALHDLFTGKLVSKHALLGKPRGPSASLAVFAAAAPATIVATRSEGDGTVALLDVSTGEVRLIPGPPVCP